MVIAVVNWAKLWAIRDPEVNLGTPEIVVICDKSSWWLREYSIVAKLGSAWVGTAGFCAIVIVSL
jgi:hypothetical protein